jgi:hypothetical protein
MEWNSAVVAEHLATNVFADWCRSVELQKHVCLQQVLCALNLAFGDHCAQTHPFALDVVQHLFALQWVTDPVDAPQAGVFVACVERLEAVA